MLFFVDGFDNEADRPPPGQERSKPLDHDEHFHRKAHQIKYMDTTPDYPSSKSGNIVLSYTADSLCPSNGRNLPFIDIGKRRTILLLQSSQKDFCNVASFDISTPAAPRQRRQTADIWR